MQMCYALFEIKVRRDIFSVQPSTLVTGQLTALIFEPLPSRLITEVVDAIIPGPGDTIIMVSNCSR